MIRLGNKVRDTICGFTGIAFARTEYLYGCARILIEPLELKEGLPIDAVWFDEQRVEVLELTEPVVSKDSSATSGGPQKDENRSRAKP